VSCRITEGRLVIGRKASVNGQARSILRPMRRMIVVLFALAVTGCAITSRDATTELPGTSWTLVDLAGAEAVGDPAPSLAFTEEGTVTGTTGCNTFNGEVSIEGSSLTFGPLATTRMACLEEELAEQEQTFLLAMEAVTGYTIDSQGRLVLEGETPLTFETAPEAE
jgi:heat shock protein HslJ